MQAYIIGQQYGGQMKWGDTQSLQHAHIVFVLLIFFNLPRSFITVFSYQSGE